MFYKTKISWLLIPSSNDSYAVSLSMGKAPRECKYPTWNKVARDQRPKTAQRVVEKDLLRAGRDSII